MITAYVNGATAEGYAEDWDLDALWTALKTLYPVGIDHASLTHRDARRVDELTREELLDALIKDAESAYAKREADIDELAGEGAMRQLERNVLLNVIDRKWREHLYEMDYLKEGIGLRAMAQRDPLVEYQREGYNMFMGMLEGLKEESVGFLFNVTVEAAPAPAVAPSPAPRGWPSSARRPGRRGGAVQQGVAAARRRCAPRELTTRQRSPIAGRQRTGPRRCSGATAGSRRPQAARRGGRGGSGARPPAGRAADPSRRRSRRRFSRRALPERWPLNAFRACSASLRACPLMRQPTAQDR